MHHNGLRRSSKTFNTLITTIEETRVIDLNEEHEITIEIIDQLLHYLLKNLKFIDPKFNFTIRNLSSLDSENRSIRQFHYFLIWKELSKPTVCRLVNDDGYSASIELLKDPKTWSRYDLDANVVKVDRKRYINGLSLRDDLVKCLMELLKNNVHQQFMKELNFKDIEFDQSTIRIIFSGKIRLPSSATPLNINTSTNSNVNPSINSSEVQLQDDEISVNSQTPSQQQQQSLPLTTIIYVLNINAMISFSDANPVLLNRMKDGLGHHEIFRDYYENFFEAKFYFLPSNSFKWVYDVVYMEHLLFEYIVSQKSLFTNAYKKLILLRKSWRKYFQKVFKVVENIKINEKIDKRRSTAFSFNDRDSVLRTSLSMFNDTNPQHFSLSYQLETSIERTLTEYLFRVLFLRQCAINKTLPDNREQFNSIMITNIFEDLLSTTEAKYCESFSFKNKNILPKCCLYFESAIQIGINKIIKEIFMDWKRGRFGH
jgi:hypothetical protein